MSDVAEVAESMARSTFIVLLEYARQARRPYSEVARQYAILLQPMPTDLNGEIRYFESLARLFGELAPFYSGPPLFEGKGNQRKLLVLRYFSKRDRATSLDVSSDMNLSLTNVSERLRRYYKQGLLTRAELVRRGRGRRTMVYKLTEAGRRRLAFLEKNVRFRRAETDRSKKYRSHQSAMEKFVRAMRRRQSSPQLADIH